MYLRIGFVVLLVSMFVGCALPSRIGQWGFIYTDVTQPVSATAQIGVKRGEACSSAILGIIAIGDASIEAARKNGGFKSISSVDEQVFSILGLYRSTCTIVYGK